MSLDSAARVRPEGWHALTRNLIYQSEKVIVSWLLGWITERAYRVKAQGPWTRTSVTLTLSKDHKKTQRGRGWGQPASREGSRRLSQDEPLLELQEAMCLLLLPMRYSDALHYCRVTEKQNHCFVRLFPNHFLFCILAEQKRDFDAYQSHEMRQAKTAAAGAGQWLLRGPACALQTDTQTVVRKYRQLIPLGSSVNPIVSLT